MSDDRDALRKVFFEAFRKHKQQTPVETLEAQLIDIMLMHPEYHTLLEKPEDFGDKDFLHENPFLHMSLHQAVREQVNTDRPFGIKQIHRDLTHKLGDVHEAEHRMMECLGQMMWQMQQNQKIPSEQDYLELLKKL